MKNLTFILFLISALRVNAQQFTWNELPAHTYPDSLHWPFILGVASSEPDTDRIYLWTYLEPDSFSQPNVTINWEIATDSSFNNVINSGLETADSNSSWTKNTLITGLTPDTYYWYRFHDERGNYSVTGRTRTFPTQSDHIKLIVSSCSNITGGFYNAYARIAERNDISAVLHLGDWVYDKINYDRAIRYEVPDPGNIACEIPKRRKRDYMHLLDPDLRAVRQMHPFIYLWDNHDIQGGLSDSLTNDCHNVYREWTGMPQFDQNDPARAYRKISLGPLADLFVIDVQYTRNDRDTIAVGEESFLGIDQYNWLLNGLRNSTARWKLVANQKLFTQFSIQGLENLVPGGVGGDEKSWDGYPLERARILSFIDSNHIDNVMILSGDAHFVVVADAAIDPFDSLAYNGETGEGSVAVEFLPSAISSPNIDERGVPFAWDDVLVNLSESLNPHQVFMEFMENGYGLLDINPDSITAQVWLMDVKQITDVQRLAAQLVLDNGVNHWKRNPVTGIAYIKPSEPSLSIFPNPASNQLTIQWVSKDQTKTQISLLTTTGKTVYNRFHEAVPGNNQAKIDVSQLAEGMYLLKMISTDAVITTRIIKQ